MVQTLEELRAENAKADEAEAKTAAENTENVEIEAESETEPQPDEEGATGETEEGEKAETTDAAETSEDDTTEPDSDDWMHGDDHTSQAEKKFTDGDIGKAKAKLKAKVNEKDGEIERLKKELAEAKAPVDDLQKPKREDFFEADDPDEAYLDALADWKLTNYAAKTQAQQQADEATRMQEIQQKETRISVDQHYERAAKLSANSDISAELYQSSDLRVRQMVDEIYPGAGDAITDSLIANVGEGSEKVFYSLGVKSSRLEKLKTLLQADKSGIKAAVYLGQLVEQANAPSKRKTQAPVPAAELKGDASSSSVVKSIKKEFDKASKKGDQQAIFDAVRKARKAGVNADDW